MNFDEIQSLWHAPINQPTAAQIEADRLKVIKKLKSRYLGFVLFSTYGCSVLALITGRLVYHLLWPRPGMDSVDFSREWAIIPLFLLPWLGWLLMVREYRRHRAGNQDYEESIQASLRALLDENRLMRSRKKIVVALLAGTMLILPLIIGQLKAVGKAGHEIDAGLVLALVILGGSLIGLVYHYRCNLLPRKRQIEMLLKSYES